MAENEADKKTAEQEEQQQTDQEKDQEKETQQAAGEEEVAAADADSKPDDEDGTSEDGEDEALQQAITEAVEAALAEQRDSVLRAQAEVQNMRRRCEQDVERAHKYALEKFSGELLVVVDNLERALQAVADSEEESVKPLYEGVELTLKGFLETMTKFNIEQINPEGEPFDPQLHEAITMQPSNEVEPNTVLAVIQKGYTLNGRVIRPSRVMVSKAG